MDMQPPIMPLFALDLNDADSLAAWHMLGYPKCLSHLQLSYSALKTPRKPTSAVASLLDGKTDEPSRPQTSNQTVEIAHIFKKKNLRKNYAAISRQFEDHASILEHVLCSLHLHCLGPWEPPALSVLSDTGISAISPTCSNSPSPESAVCRSNRLLPLSEHVSTSSIRQLVLKLVGFQQVSLLKLQKMLESVHPNLDLIFPCLTVQLSYTMEPDSASDGHEGHEVVARSHTRYSPLSWDDEYGFHSKSPTCSSRGMSRKP
jgi:hypothetical protein